MTISFRAWALGSGCALLAAAAPAGAQNIPVRTLAPVLASPLTFGQIHGAVALPGGQMVVNDRGQYAVWLLDSTLAHPVAVYDSIFGKSNTYPAGADYVMPFAGDSALFFDGRAGVLVVITPRGEIGRTLTPPSGGRATVAGGMSVPAFASNYDPPEVSLTQGLVFHMAAARNVQRPTAGGLASEIHVEDSSVVIRMNFATHKQDTVAKMGTGRFLYMNATGVGLLDNLFPFYDDVAVMADGTVALLHAREYRVEWIGPDGARSAGSKLSYPWQRITDDERQRLVDSVNGAKKRTFDSLLTKYAADTLAGKKTNVITLMADGTRSVRAAPLARPRPPVLIWPTDIPDFRPPVEFNALMPDADNQLWIRALPQRDSSATMWDVIDRRGTPVERVRIPHGISIVAFGKGGILYGTTGSSGTQRLQKFRIQ